MTTQEQLGARCDRVAQGARDALAWVTDEANAETVGPDRKPLVQALRRGARRAQRLARSARTRMSISVFGPSQAGKSFLVSVLARPRDGRLAADFGGPGGQLDYISEINPAGDGESTGLVTRFTMSKAPTPEGYPIQLVLLSEADIARTIINSFYKDGDQSELPPEPAALGAHVAAFEGRAGPAEVPGLSYEEMFEIAEYVENTFGRSAYAAALKGFYEEAAAIAPRLPIAERGAFLSILWGGYQPLTDLYVQLARALAEIDHAEIVHAPLSALVPRDRSIIDVKTLHGLFAGEEDRLALRTPGGKVAHLSRAVVCALAAELVFPMLEEPSPLFAQTDLLDFPGARNRFEQPLSRTLQTPAETVTQMLLRGKVAYLFDRYVANQEITSMLLCVPDSNMETLDLPPLVENWVALTHGATPRQRAQAGCILFFVMTKFDKHLGESASGGSPSERFERRMKASLLEAFGKLKSSWVHEWTPGVPFRNCFWLRNPNYFVEGLLDYDARNAELRIRPEKAERVAELKEGCLATPAVQAHFKEPERAWDAALTLNDGGVGYLIEELTRVCTAESKVAQIGAQIEKLAEDLAGQLRPHHVSDDIGQRIEEKRAAAAEIIDGLEIALQRHRFGAVLAALMVDQDQVQDRISRVPSSIRISSAVSSAASVAAQPRAAAGPLRPPPRPGRPNGAPSRPEPAPEAQASPLGNIRTMTPEAFQAESSIEVWVEGLKRFRDDLDTIGHFGLTQTSVTNLNAELTHALRRCGVVERIKDQLRAMNFGHTVDKQAEPASIVCAERINGFVTTLGFSDRPEETRPRIDLGEGHARAVFTIRPRGEDADGLPPLPRAAAEDLWTDWVFALDAMVVENAQDGGSGAVNVAQNMRLGGILAAMTGEGGHP
ncbi:virulence factor SrfC family protein (plasmid) [Cereibacter azotoformans]|uniref:virulence factor SrfC family protein n=2 Tax=Cereibacter azotoformans TaxID=43057 RepID=UPI003B21263C